MERRPHCPLTICQWGEEGTSLVKLPKASLEALVLGRLQIRVVQFLPDGRAFENVRRRVQGLTHLLNLLHDLHDRRRSGAARPSLHLENGLDFFRVAEYTGEGLSQFVLVAFLSHGSFLLHFGIVDGHHELNWRVEKEVWLDGRIVSYLESLGACVQFLVAKFYSTLDLCLLKETLHHGVFGPCVDSSVDALNDTGENRVERDEINRIMSLTHRIRPGPPGPGCLQGRPHVHG